MKKTTKEDFELFKKECERWIDFFGLKDWSVSFEWAEIDDHAQNHSDTKNKWSVIILGKEWSKISYNKESIKESAFHEVVHLLHRGFDFLYRSEFRNDDIYNRECESFVRIMENSVFKSLKKPKK